MAEHPTVPNDTGAVRWLAVPGYEGLYEVSSDGRVRSIDRVISLHRNGKLIMRRLRGRPLRSSVCQGYRQVVLSRDGKELPYRVYKLVALAFLGPVPLGEEVCHGPNGKLDDSASHIYYGTRSQNMGADRVRDGQDARGENSVNAKLTWQAVSEIRRQWALLAEHERRGPLATFQHSVARQYGVSNAAVSMVVNRHTWRYPPDTCQDVVMMPHD